MSDTRNTLTISMGQIIAHQTMLGLMKDGGYIRLDAETGKWIEVKGE